MTNSAWQIIMILEVGNGGVPPVSLPCMDAIMKIAILPLHPAKTAKYHDLLRDDPDNYDIELPKMNFPRPDSEKTFQWDNSCLKALTKLP